MLNRYKKITNDIVKMVSNMSGENQKTLNVLAPINIRKNIAALANYCAMQGLVIGTSGQIFFRLPSKKILVTHPDISFSRLSSSDFNINSLDNDFSASETMDVFQKIYIKILQQSNNNAVLICQPSASLSIAAKDNEINPILLKNSPEVLTFSNESDFLKSELDIQQIEKTVILIRGFGLITYGSTVEEAIDKAETFERLCQIMINISKK